MEVRWTTQVADDLQATISSTEIQNNMVRSSSKAILAAIDNL